MRNYAHASPQDTGTQDAYKGPCPPTIDKLAANSIVKGTLDEAMKRAQSRKVEHGGWIYWKKGTGKITTIIKEPTIDHLNVSGQSDGYFRVFLHNPPPPPRGWEIVGMFHIHLEDGGPSGDFDIAATDQYKVPGIVRTPDGKIHTYGNYNPGVWNKDLPSHCK